MNIKLYAMTCGWMTVKASIFLEGADGRLVIPVPCYLIDHPRGMAVFDTGLNHAVQYDAEARIGNLAKAFTIDFNPGESLAERLEHVDVDAARIQYLINSHLHFDHAGGNDSVPNARLVVQKREWHAGHDPDLAHANGFDKQDFDLGHDLITPDGEHDLFGDGSVMCVPTYGHTPGHQSLKVKLDGGDVLLTGDACYLRETLENLRLPRVVYDRDEMLKSLQAIKALQARGVRIFYGHDAQFWRTVPQAPVAIT